MRAEDVKEFLNNPEIREKYGIIKNIHLATVKRWLKKLGYQWVRRHRGQYADCYDFYPTLHFSPFLSLPSTGRWAIFVHRYLFISFNYYLLLTQAQQCTVCLLMHSLHSTHSTLTYAQPSCTVYKDVMDTHFQ